MIVGYARVSTLEQILDLQKDALAAAGCAQIFTDTASGASTERFGLEQALSYVRVYTRLRNEPTLTGNATEI